MFPFGVELDELLRFLAGGGLFGGASATVAFFLPRGILAEPEQPLDIAVPILNGYSREYRGVVGKICGRGFGEQFVNGSSSCATFAPHPKT